MSDDARHRWIMDEIPAVRRHLEGRSGLVAGVIIQAYADAHAARPDVKTWRGRRLIEASDPAGFLEGEGRQLYHAMERQKDRS